MRSFTYANLSADSLQGYFDNFCSKTGTAQGAAPSQCGAASDASKSLANSGALLVD